MTPPNNPVQQTDVSSAISDISNLVLSSDYYQHKANECRDLIDGLEDWKTVPCSNLGFSVGGRLVASFKIGPNENEFLQTVLMSLVVYYQRKAGEVRSAMDRVCLVSTDSLG